MKKTLITIILTILITVGAYASTVSVLADSYPNISYIDKDGSQVIFTVDNQDLEKVVIEYTFTVGDILMSRLEEFYVMTFSTNQDTKTYKVNVPEEALSVKIWRVINSDDQIMSLTGTLEWDNSDNDKISDVETRLKTIYIDNDLITRESNLTGVGTVLQSAWTFRMHFNLDDALGETIPVDHIYSLKVSYDVIRTTMGIKTTTSITKDIQENVTTRTQYWPFFYPSTIINNIRESIDDDYDWMVNLGTYTDVDGPITSFLSDVTIDQTTVLAISYVYNGVFYEDQEVQDEPYDSDDIVDVVPGTTDPIQTIGDWLDSLGKTLKNIVIILIVILAILIISLVLKGVRFVASIIKLFFTTIKWVGIIIYTTIKYIILGIVWIVKSILKIPGILINMLLFLFVPKNARRKESLSDVSRYI